MNSEINIQHPIKDKLTYNGSTLFDSSFFINGNVPHMFYDGLSICQHYNVIEKFYELFDKIKPSRVIEIGAAGGGLTLLLRDILDSLHLKNVPVVTYDIIESPIHNRIKINNLNIDFYKENIFSSNYDKLIDDKLIKQQIQSDGVTVLLCDGGFKRGEFNLLSKFLKTGDIIMAHDYAKDEKFFNEQINNKIWYWHEIQDSHIEQSVKEYNLKPFMQEKFDEVVWVCKIKQ